MFCDLHLHSTKSDGTDTPSELIALAKEKNLIAALTDHNTADGIEEFLTAADAMGVTAIGGAEFTADCHGSELHILGLFLTPDELPAIRGFTDDYRHRKIESNRQVVKLLQEKGYHIRYERLLEQYEEIGINRAHIAEELVKAGDFPAIRIAFTEVLDQKRGLYRPPKRSTHEEVICFIRSVHAVPVLAHPFLSEDSAETVEKYLPEMVAAGLIGMETLYSEYDEATTERAKRLAARYGLSESGGSDYHGTRKPDIFMGCGKGNLQVPESVYRNLRDIYEQGT